MFFIPSYPILQLLSSLQNPDSQSSTLQNSPWLPQPFPLGHSGTVHTPFFPSWSLKLSAIVVWLSTWDYKLFEGREHVLCLLPAWDITDAQYILLGHLFEERDHKDCIVILGNMGLLHFLVPLGLTNNMDIILKGFLHHVWEQVFLGLLLQATV